MIGIITLGQDTFTNPTLYSIIARLNEKEIPVGIFSGFQHSAIPSELKYTTYYKAPKGLDLPRRPDNIFNYLKVLSSVIYQLKKNKVKHLIAVDPSGLIMAGRLKKILKKLRIHYFSFEIFFEEEIKAYPALVEIKNKEIFYSQQVETILIQDTVRQKLLQKENRIKPSFTNWHLVPVSPIINANHQNKFAKRRLGLKETDIVYVHSGSIADWAGITMLIETIEKGLPDDTYILIHNKSKFQPANETHQILYALKENGANLILHDELFESYMDYFDFLACLDYGIVLYKPDDGVFTGMNIKEIGLSSGKFSTYMAAGLPSILSACTSYIRLTEEFEIGVIVDKEHDLHYHIQNKSLLNFSKSTCRSFYDQHLNADQALKPLLDVLSKMNCSQSL